MKTKLISSVAFLWKRDQRYYVYVDRPTALHRLLKPTLHYVDLSRICHTTRCATGCKEIHNILASGV